MRGQIIEKRGVVDVEKIGRKSFKLTYWNGLGYISAVGIYQIGDGVHLIDCNNPYDDEGDRNVVKAMEKISFFCEVPFEDAPAWVKNYQAEIAAEKARKDSEEFFRNFNCPFNDARTPAAD